jgi:hypothetical protein
MAGARQTFAVMITFRKSNKNSLALIGKVGGKIPILLYSEVRKGVVASCNDEGRCTYCGEYSA